MNIDDRVNYWIDIAEYDMETAKAMLAAKRYLYVGFMCHQVIEKIMKAYYWKVVREEPPYIHNLSQLSKKTGLYDMLNDVRKDFIDYLEPLNIRGRYPRDKEELLAVLTDKNSAEILNSSEDLYKWIYQLIKQ